MRKHLHSLLALLISIPATASITGVVINSDGQPIAGAKVSIYAPETIEAHRLRLVSAKPDRTALSSMNTDSKGTFNFESPKDQRVVDLTIEANGYAPDAMRLLADDEAGAIALLAAPMQRGTITASGKAVAGATVVWMGNSSDFLSKTDAEGHYSVPDPSKWANRLIIVHPDYAIVDETLPFRTAPKLDRTLNTGVTIKGRVVSEDGKTAVAKAPLLIDDFPLAVTGDDGTFTITHAPANWQELQTRSGNLAGVRARVTADAAVNIRLVRSGRITGTVRDAKTQLPLASAEVRLAPEMQFSMRVRGFNAAGAPSAIESVLTDAKGNFTLSVPASRYRLAALYPGSTVANASISVTAGQTVNKTMYPAARARVSGVVANEDRRPVAGARLIAAPLRDGGGPMMLGPAMRFQQDMTAFSGPDGRFVL
ncbi:MAG TPA: carboxypeptidase-like regulatory domain-containing protein, partial [Thermoanaerobaculia bacterium]